MSDLIQLTWSVNDTSVITSSGFASAVSTILGIDSSRVTVQSITTQYAKKRNLDTATAIFSIKDSAQDTGKSQADYFIALVTSNNLIIQKNGFLAATASYKSTTSTATSTSTTGENVSSGEKYTPHIILTIVTALFIL